MIGTTGQHLNLFLPVLHSSCVLSVLTCYENVEPVQIMLWLIPIGLALLSTYSNSGSWLPSLLVLLIACCTAYPCTWQPAKEVSDSRKPRFCLWKATHTKPRASKAMIASTDQETDRKAKRVKRSESPVDSMLGDRMNKYLYYVSACSCVCFCWFTRG